MRDSQRQKVYRAENLWQPTGGEVAATYFMGSDGYTDIKTAQIILNDLSDFFEVKRPVIYVNVRLKQWSGWYFRGRIEVPREGMSLQTVLHEFSHHLDTQRRRIDEDSGTTENHFGWRGHGGSFTEAMIDVAWRFYGKDDALSLISCYRFKKIAIGRDEEAEAVAKSEKNNIAIAARKRERHKEEGDVYVVRLLRKKDGYVTFLSDNGYWDKQTYYQHHAKGFRTESAAERNAERVGRYYYDTEVLKVPGYFDRNLGWQAY